MTIGRINVKKVGCIKIMTKLRIVLGVLLLGSVVGLSLLSIINSILGDTDAFQLNF